MQEPTEVVLDDRALEQDWRAHSPAKLCCRLRRSKDNQPDGLADTVMVAGLTIDTPAQVHENRVRPVSETPSEGRAASL